MKDNWNRTIYVSVLGFPNVFEILEATISQLALLCTNKGTMALIFKSTIIKPSIAMVLLLEKKTAFCS